jgi:hypothetical protein
MKRWLGFAAAIAMVAIVAGSASAQDQQRQRRPGGGQPGGGFGGGRGMTADPVFLLGQESVQKELSLSEEQVKKVKDFQEKRRAAFQQGGGGGFGNREEMQKRMEEMRKENEKFVGDTLKPEQAKRLNQISLQQRGAGAINDAKIQDDLKFSDEQKEKVKAINEDAARSRRDLGFQPGQPPSEEQRAKMAELNKATNEKLQNILTADQKAKWKEMTGEEFKGKIEAPQFRRPGGGQ